MFFFFWLASDAGDAANQTKTTHEARHISQFLLMSHAVLVLVQNRFSNLSWFLFALPMPPLFYTIEELAPSGLYGRDFLALIADETYFVLDPLQDSQLQLWPPESLDAELPVFLYNILVAEMERRCLPVPERYVSETA